MRNRSFVAQAEGSFSMPVASGLKVMDGFLVPVLLGFFQPDTATNFEQPIAAWEDDLAAAGFGDVRSEPIFRYWWADACLVTARSPRARTGGGAPNL